MAKNVVVKTKDGRQFDVPASGSLGLLALGYTGLMLWRKKRYELSIAEKKDLKDPSKKNEKK